MLNPKIQTASWSDRFPRRYVHFCIWLILKFSGGSYLEAGISLSPGTLSQTRMSCLDQYQGIREDAKFYRTLVLDGDKYRDSKYYRIIWIGPLSIELLTINSQSELKFTVGKRALVFLQVNIYYYYTY